jgi:hypothetical protein
MEAKEELRRNNSEIIALPWSINIGGVSRGLMNRTAATCIAGIRSKATSKSRIHFFRRPRKAKPFTRFSAAFHGKKTITEQQVSFY